MDAVNITFLTNRVVQDDKVGTPLETRFDAGRTYALDPRSADRWVKRGAARYASIDDAARGSGAASDVALSPLDRLRDEGAFAGGLAGGGQGGGDASFLVGSGQTLAEEEEARLSIDISALLLAAKLGIEPEGFKALPREERIEHLRTGFAEIHAGFLRGDEDQILKLGSDEDRVLPGAEPPPAPPLDQTPDLEGMTDDQLRDFIETRDKKRPPANARRDTLLARAKGEAED